MKQLTKKVLKELRKVAAELPPLEYVVKEVAHLPGKELKLTGISPDEFDGIDDNEVYEIDNPAYYQWNHYRRMKRIYLAELKHGHDHAYALVKDYITGVMIAAKREAV